MTFLLTLLGTVVAVLLLRPAMKAAPWAFYLLGIVLDGVLLAASLNVLPSQLSLIVIPLLRRNFLALSLFVVVMYVGVFPYGSAPRNYLGPVRAVIAILACILALGHMVVYFTPYITNLFTGNAQSAPIAVSMTAGLILLVLLLILGITSFRFVRKRMSGRTWIKLQRWSYLFYALVYVHAMCLLIPPALGGGQAARISVIVYSVVFIVYAIARIARAVIDHRDAERALANRQEELEGQAL